MPSLLLFKFCLKGVNSLEEIVLSCHVFSQLFSSINKLNKFLPFLSGLPVQCQVLAVSLVRDGSSYKDPSWETAVSAFTWPPLRDSPTAKQDILDGISRWLH